MAGAVLCDFDGVLRLWSEDGVTDIEREFGLPAGAIGGAAFAPELLHEAVSGRISDEHWRERIAADLVTHHGPAARDAVAAWSELGGALDVQMLALLGQVRRSVPVVLVSNATSRLASDLEALGLGDAFDAVANSSEIGAAKPDVAIFERAAALVGVRLRDCVVIDDQPGHLEGARTAGAAVIRHETVAATRAALVKLGLLPLEDAG